MTVSIPRSIRKTFFAAASLLTGLWLAACQPVQTTMPAPSGGSSEQVVVALLVPTSSANGQEKQLAKDLESAARLAVADLKGVKVDLRVYDTSDQAAMAQQAALKAVEDGADIILGPLHAESANAAAVAVANKGVNVLSFSNNPTIAGGNLFVLGHTFENTAMRLAGFAQSQGKSRIVAVYSDNLEGQLGLAAIEAAVSNTGGTLAGSVAHEFSQNGVVAAVPSIRATVEANGANAIFLTANSAGALPLFSQMLPESGLTQDKVQYIGLSRWDTPPQTLALPGIQGGWFALPDPGRTAQFAGRFEAAYGSRPHPIAGLAYDGIAAIGALAALSSGDPFGRGALIQSAGFQGVNGIFRLRADGSNERALAVATIRDQKMLIISPAPQGFGGAGF